MVGLTFRYFFYLIFVFFNGFILWIDDQNKPKQDLESYSVIKIRIEFYLYTTTLPACLAWYFKPTGPLGASISCVWGQLEPSARAYKCRTSACFVFLIWYGKKKGSNGFLFLPKTLGHMAPNDDDAKRFWNSSRNSPNKSSNANAIQKTRKCFFYTGCQIFVWQRLKGLYCGGCWSVVFQSRFEVKWKWLL